MPLSKQASLSPDFLALLACPETNQSLMYKDESLVTDPSNFEQIQLEKKHRKYPLIGGIPWLIPYPRNSLLDWGAKLNQFQQVFLREISEIEQTLRLMPNKQSNSTIDRLNNLVTAKKEFLIQVSQLIEPVTQAQISLTSSALPLLDCALPTQNLLSYEANVYRDWVWGECENERTKEIVLALSPDKLGKFIVLGAGAGRLAIDLHVDAKPELTVACDLNPLFLLLLNKLKSGDGIELTEFPLQPKSSEFVAIKHYIDLLKADLKPAHLDDFHLCFADAAKPAFKRYCFDTVLTPWLIDIQPYDFKVFLIQLNQYLDIAGTWLNIGSLVFNHKRDSLCYQEQEVIEIAAACGFKIERIEQHEIPYLQSPYNAGHRIENMWCWRAIKIKHVLPHTQHQVRPLWLIDHESPIPVSDQIHQNQQNSQYIADMLAAIDGERSIRDISKEMAKQYGSEAEEHQLEVYRYLLSQTQT